MFYETAKNNHGLPHNPFHSCVIPRPIGWITSLDAKGKVNLAPFSYYNAVSYNPPMIMFSATKKLSTGEYKDTLSNVESRKEFVVNLTPFALREQVKNSSVEYPSDISELENLNLKTPPSELIETPRILGTPIHLECKHYQTIQLLSVEGESDIAHTGYRMIIAYVVGIHIDNDVIKDGKIDVGSFMPIARLGYMDYATVEANNIFEL